MRHCEKQATVVTSKEKKASSKPFITAPRTLVTANVMPKRITDVRIVPKIPVNRTGRIEHTQLRRPHPMSTADNIKVIARYTIAIPNKVHKNAGVMVMTAVKLKNAVIIPMIMPATMEIPIQLLLLLQQHNDIKFSPPI